MAWKTVDSDGNLYSLSRGSKAGRVQKVDGKYVGLVGRLRKPGTSQSHWSWEEVDRPFDTPGEAKLAVERRLPDPKEV